MPQIECEHFAMAATCQWCAVTESVQRARLDVMRLARHLRHLEPVEATLTQALRQLDVAVKRARIGSADLLAPSAPDGSHALERL